MQNGNNAQGVVPGYQPLRTNAPRSNTAGKHGAQQQLNPHATGALPTTSQGQRPGGIKFKKTISGGVSHQADAGGAAASSMIGQQYVPHSNPNFSDAQTSGQVFEKSSKPIDRSDPQLKKATGTHGSSPRPGAGQIKIQQIIRGHYQGASNSGGNNSSNTTQMLQQATANQQVGKSKSTNQRPLRSSRQQISPSIVNQLQANPLQGGFDGASNSFQGAKIHAGNNGSNSSRLPTGNHGLVQHSMTQNQTPNISNFHPPAIQKHEMSGGRQNSRRNARHAQINKNHPDLMVQNSTGNSGQGSQAHPHYSYSKQRQANQQSLQSNSGVQSSQHQPGSYHHVQQPSSNSATQDTSTGSGGVAKFMRPNTASETRKFMQQNSHGAGEHGGVAGPQSATVGSPLLPPNRQGGLVVPQPNGAMAQDPNGILAASSRRRGNANGGTPGVYQGNGASGGAATSSQTRGGRQANTGNDSKNPMSLSHDQALPHRRPTKEDTLFPDKKGQTVQSGTLGGLGGPNSPQQPQLNTINGFSGNERNGATTSRVPVSQSLDHSFIRNQGPPIVNTNSASQINQLGGPHHHQNGAANSGHSQQNSHQRITSQHNQSIPQYRKANLRDLRKSQRLSHNNGANHQLVTGGPASKENQINPLTSVELNQHFVKQRQGAGGGQGQRSSKDMQQLNHGNATGRSLDHAKRQLIMPNSSGGQNLTGTSAQSHQQMNQFHNAQVTKSLQPPSSTGHGQQNNNGNSQNAAGTNLIPSGYKRRSKRPGQGMNQASLHFNQNIQGSGSGIPGQQQDGLHDHHHNMGNMSQHKDSSQQPPSSRKQRLELTSINNHSHQRGSSDHQQPLSSERNKHSRQKNNLVSNSLDNAFQKRIPSVNSINRNNNNAGNSVSNSTPGAGHSTTINGPSHPQQEHQDQEERVSSQNQTPKGSNKEPQKPTSAKDGEQATQGQGNERFNAITKFAFATSCGHQPGNPYKVNQDTYTLAPNMCGQQGFHLFVVCDGHGVNGHKVSGDIKQELPKELEQKLQIDQDFLDNTMSREFQERIPRYFRDSFSTIHEQLMTNRPFDCNLSGSTVCAVMFDSLRIYCANAGDSRAVLYTQGKKGGLKVTPLSEDHKPSLPKERMRVEKVGGRVNPIIGPQGQHLGPDRVWMATEDTPGLAMSRSLGDGLAHTLGVSWEPEVKQLVLEPSDKFIVIASDGVWEFLSNEQIARIVWPYYIKNSPEQAGNAIVRASAQKWKENDTVIDDITCITIFLEVD